MTVMRGMLWVAIAVSAAFLFVGNFVAHSAATDETRRIREAWENDVEVWNVLRCGGQFLGKDMGPFTNQYGYIDIGRAGCHTGTFPATFNEIHEALNSPRPAEPASSYFEHWWNVATLWLFLGSAAFIVVNLIGLAFIGVRSVARWILAGFGS